MKSKIFLLSIVIIMSGCSGIKPTLVYQIKDFQSKITNEIAVLSVQDARLEEVKKLKFKKKTKKIQPWIVKRLEKKGYSAYLVEEVNALGSIQPIQIPFLDKNKIKTLGPPQANWVLIPVLVDYSQYGGETIYYLYDKIEGKLVWEGSANFKKLFKGAKKVFKKFPSK